MQKLRLAWLRVLCMLGLLLLLVLRVLSLIVERLRRRKKLRLGKWLLHQCRRWCLLTRCQHYSMLQQLRQLCGKGSEGSRGNPA